MGRNVRDHSTESLGPHEIALVERTVRSTLQSLNEQVLPLRKEWLCPKEAAEFLRLHPAHLAKLRSKGGGPAFHAIGPRLVRYHVDELSEWIRGGSLGALLTCSENSR